LTNRVFFEKILEKEGIKMYRERILLTPKDILEKEFKIDTRGYRPQEVDKFLDTIISDYEEMFTIIKELEREKKTLVEDSIRLKQEIRNLRGKIELLSESSGDSTSADVLRRLSNLEKTIYGNK
jgi:DivIVA domain-containing protein